VQPRYRDCKCTPSLVGSSVREEKSQSPQCRLMPLPARDPQINSQRNARTLRLKQNVLRGGIIYDIGSSRPNGKRGTHSFASNGSRGARKVDQALALLKGFQTYKCGNALARPTIQPRTVQNWGHVIAPRYFPSASAMHDSALPNISGERCKFILFSWRHLETSCG
jgi:hypothetical protein